jgi:HTH-type transcriptional regulator/antitoxin HigA
MKHAINESRAPLSHAVPDDYFDLIREFPLRTIRSDRDLARALDVSQRLMARNEKALTSGESDYLGALAILIHDYETHRYPPNAEETTPLQRLRFLMEENGLTPVQLQKLLGCSQTLVSLILNGRRELSKENIRRLAEHFKVQAGYFM